MTSGISAPKDGMEFAGHSWAECFRHASDWLAANDGEVEDLLAVSPRYLTGHEPGMNGESMYLLSILFDGRTARSTDAAEQAAP